MNIYQELKKTAIKADVISISDGDTIKVKVKKKKKKIRLLGIDTPELHYRVRNKVYSQGKYAEDSTKYLEKLIEKDNGDVLLVHDVEKKDVYRRDLCYILSPNKEKIYQSEMLKDGQAFMYQIYPNLKLVYLFSMDVLEAVCEKKGLFSKDSKCLFPKKFRMEKSGKPNKRYVGDLSSLKIYSPHEMDKVEHFYRIFFSKRDLKEAYKLGFHK